MADTIAVLEILINAKADKAAKDLASLDATLQKTAQSADKAGQSLGTSLTSNAQNAANAALRLSTAQARGATLAGNYGEAQRILSAGIEQFKTAADGSTASAIRLQQAENALSVITNRAEGNNRSLLGSLDQLKAGFDGVASVAGTIGIGLGAQQIVSFGVDAAKSAIQLKNTENALKQIAGSQQTYNQILNAAKQQQITFGGSLQENIAALQSFAVVARTSGASLDDLIRTSQRLATLNSEQGIEGAKVGIAEALAGQTTSLKNRFNIPSQALEKLRDNSVSATQKLQILNQYLDKAGISANGAADSISKEAKALNEFGAAADQAKNSLGGLLALKFTPAVQGATQLLQALNGTGNAFAGLQGLNSAVGTLAGNFGSVLAPVAAYNTAVLNAVGSGLNLIGVQTQNVSANNQAASSASNYANVLNAAAGNEQAYYAATQGGTAAVLQRAQANIQAAVSGQLLAQSDQNAVIATQASAEASLNDTAAKEQNNVQMQVLEAQTQAAANSFLALNPNITQSGLASAVASGQISTAVAQYIAMTLHTAEARAELARLQAQAGVSVARQANVGARQRRGGQLDDNGPYFDQKNIDSIRGATAAVKSQQIAEEKRNAALRDEVLTTGSAAEKRAQYNRELQDATKIYGADSAEAIRARTALEAFDQSQEKASKKRKAAGAGKLSDQQRLNNSLLANEEAANNKFEDADLQHAKKLLDIQKDYAAKRLAADRELKQSLLDNEGDLYDTLIKLDDQGLARQVDAQYQAFKQNELPQLAKEKGADVANAYANEYEKTLKARAERQDEINKLRSKKDDSGKDKSKAQAAKDANDATALEGLDKIKRQAEDERLRQIKEGRDSLAEQEKQATDEENLRYEEAQGKIADAADRSAERQILAAQRAGKQIDENTLKVQKLGKAYDRVAGGTGGDTAQNATQGGSEAPQGAGGANGDKDTTTLSDLLEQLQSILDAIKDDTSKTVSAVNGAGRSISGAISGLR